MPSRTSGLSNQNSPRQSPLAGKRIAVTRAREQAGGLRNELEKRGAQVIAIPTIRICPPDSWGPLDSALRRLSEFDYLLLTSANAVRNVLARLTALRLKPRDLQRLTIGAIGPATAAELERAGVKVDLVPEEYVAEGLLAALGDRDVRGKAFLIPRAKVARDVVPRVLEERGARVEVVEAYQTLAADISPEEIRDLLTPPPDAITFTSSSTAANFASLVGADHLNELLRGVVIASIGPITSHTLRNVGLQVTVEARESTMAGLVTALVEHSRERKRETETVEAVDEALAEAGDGREAVVVHAELRRKLKAKGKRQSAKAKS